MGYGKLHPLCALMTGVSCPRTFCETHCPPEMTAADGCPALEELGYKRPSTCYYVVCSAECRKWEADELQRRKKEEKAKVAMPKRASKSRSRNGSASASAAAAEEEDSAWNQLKKSIQPRIRAITKLIAQTNSASTPTKKKQIKTEPSDDTDSDTASAASDSASSSAKSRSKSKSKSSKRKADAMEAASPSASSASSASSSSSSKGKGIAGASIVITAPMHGRSPLAALGGFFERLDVIHPLSDQLQYLHSLLYGAECSPKVWNRFFFLFFSFHFFSLNVRFLFFF